MTIVQFIGLFVLIYTNNVGYQILMPHFTMTPEHPSLIAYPVDDRIVVIGEDQWAPAGHFTRDDVTWDYVAVDKQYITISGATDGVPDKLDPGPDKPGPPHLSCCCTALRPFAAGGQGINDRYQNPNLSKDQKLGAQVVVTRGVSSSLVDPKGDPKGRIDTQFTMNTIGGDGITIRGTDGTIVKQMMFKPGARIIFGNTPICILEKRCSTDTPDFVQYYTMAVENSQCLGAPSICTQCRITATPCTSSSCGSARGKKKTVKMKHEVHSGVYMGTIDCSNSQWP